MPRPRFNKLAPEKRSAILDAAMEEFSAHGFEKASYNKIIEKAGVSKGAMYYYFDDKADLYATVFKGVLDQMNELVISLEPVTTPEEFWIQLRIAVERMLSLSCKRPKVMGLMRGAMELRFHSSASLENPALKELMEIGGSVTTLFLKRGQEVGAIRSDLPFELMVNMVRALDDAGDRWVMENSDMKYESIRDWIDQFLDLVWRLLSPDLPTSRPR